MGELTMGKLARRAGVNAETLRYYERRGLLPRPPRTASNYRLYPEASARRVRFIKRAQEMGFSLREIGELLSLRARPGAKCADVLGRAREKVRDIDAKMEALRAMRKALSRLTRECSGKGPVTECPILEALDPEEIQETPPRGARRSS